MLSSLVLSHIHTHTAWPSLASPWCADCSAMLDWRIVLVDHQHAKEGVAP
jgi:hypothetical protein